MEILCYLMRNVCAVLLTAVWLALARPRAGCRVSSVRSRDDP